MGMNIIQPLLTSSLTLPYMLAIIILHRSYFCSIIALYTYTKLEFFFFSQNWRTGELSAALRTVRLSYSMYSTCGYVPHFVLAPRPRGSPVLAPSANHMAQSCDVHGISPSSHEYGYLARFLEGFGFG